LALTTPTGGGGLVGIVRSQTQAMEFLVLIDREEDECRVTFIMLKINENKEKRTPLFSKFMVIL
jgi:hypothetical protein